MHLKIDSESKLSLIPNIGLKFHIIGIGGIGMSAIAEVLHKNGLYVQGSDAKESNNTKRLEKLGIKCYIEHNINNVQNVNIIAYSSAIKTDNIEYLEGLRLNKIMMSRHQILHEILSGTWNICVSGMHGKTTTTSMISMIFEYSKQQFVSIVGGVMEYNQSNAIVHSNAKWSVVEADESDDSFIKIPITIPVITNISPEHLDHHLTLDIIKDKFVHFLEKIPYYGFGVVCIDDPIVKEILNKIKNKTIYTYSTQDKSANFFADNISIIENNKIVFELFVNRKLLDIITLNIFGEFNISNCLASIAVSYKLGINLDLIKKALSNFRTTKRRFEIIGNFLNATVVDDYAHHPREIDVVLKTVFDFAESNKVKLFVVLQPHRYSRWQKLYNSFIEILSNHKINKLIILPFYSAGENPIQNINSQNIVAEVKNSIYCEYDDSKLKSILINNNLSEGDIILFMGAGNVTDLAHKILISSNELSYST